MKVIVVGGGPAGMLSAISAKNEGNEVILLEKNNRLGKKLSITGKGRCNITSSLENMSDFISNTPGNGRFLYSAFQNFTNKDILKMLNIPTKNERGNRVFPVSDRAEDVVEALKRKLNGVEVKLESPVKNIIVKDGVAIGVETDKEKIYGDKIILATGGLSYPSTGSTGDGLKMAEKLGHHIVEPKPSLVALTASENSIEDCIELTGLTLKNVSLNVYVDNKKVYDDFGEMLFTHFGISGPIVLSASAHLVRTNMKNVKFEIDLKPGLNDEKLNDRILRDFSKYKNKEIKNSLNDLLPKAMIPVIIRRSEIKEDKKVNDITKKERMALIKNIKHFVIEINGFRPIREAIVTAGGVSVKEINPKTMESKLIKNLYFAGEIIDVDAYTGGFNLQIAYSTGFTAGLNQ